MLIKVRTDFKQEIIMDYKFTRTWAEIDLDKIAHIMYSKLEGSSVSGPR